MKMEFQKEVDDLKTELQSAKKELIEVNAKLAEATRKVDALERKLQLTKNTANEVKRENEKPKRGRETRHRYELRIRKRSQTSAVDNSRKKKCICEESTRFENCIIVLGTFNNKAFFKDVIKIKLNRANEASTIGQLPLSVNGESAAAVCGNSLFVTGLGENLDKIMNFDARSSKWEYCNTMIRGRRGHSVAFVDHVLYICGGWVDDGEITIDDVETYDTINNKSTTVGKLVHAVRNSGNCVPFKSSLYIFGGRDSNGKDVDYVQVYDTKSNYCTLLSKRMPVTYRLLRAVLWENKAILLGCDNCFIYNFDTGAWQLRDQFKTDVIGFGMIVHNGKLFVIGGGIKQVDVDGNDKWICRDDVRSVPVANVLNNESIEWLQHAKLPKPTGVYCSGKIEFPVQ